MKHRLCSFFVTVFVLAAVDASAAEPIIYKTVDEQGNVEYSDKPPADGMSAERVDVNPTNTAAPPPQVARPKKAPKAPSTNYETVITSPADGTTIPMGPGNFSVSAEVNPALGTGQRLQLLLDGEAQGAPQRGRTWRLTNVFRGEHRLVVQRLGANDKVLHESDPLTVYVFRPSVR